MDVTEDNIENEDIGELEKLLRKWENDETLVLSDIDCSAGSRKGDNYMSIVKRVKINGKWKNNESVYKNSLIVKRQLLSRSRRQLFRCDEAFNNEIAAYCHLIPAMKKFSKNTLPFPTCLFAGVDNTDAGEVVILEDLGTSGYQMVDRTQGLDYHHTSLVLQKLGHFHAISLAMKCLDAQAFNDAKKEIQDIIYCPEAAQFYSHQLEMGLREALASLRSSNKNHELDIPIQCMENLSGKLYDIMNDYIHADNETWKVICHGDLWTNNLLFQKNHKKHTINAKIVDLQTIRYATPVIDILQFLYSSTEKDLRLQYFDQLIRDYRSALVDTLKEFMLPNNVIEYQKLEKEFTVANIINEFNKYALYGLGTTVWLLPAVTFHPDRTPDLDTVTLNDITSCSREMSVADLYTPEYHTRLKDVVLEYYAKGYFNNN